MTTFKMSTTSLTALCLCGLLAFGCASDPGPSDASPAATPDAAETQSLAEQQGALVYGPGDKPMCADEDLDGNSYQGAPYNAPERPLWSAINIPHPYDVLNRPLYDEECQQVGTETVPLKNVPDYKNLTHNLNLIQSLQFFISIAQNISSTLDKASEAVKEGDYVGDVADWAAGQVIPQTTGHCVCIGNCSTAGCDPNTILQNAQQSIDTIIQDMNIEDLLTEFLLEKLDPLIQDLQNLQDYIEGRLTNGQFLLDILGNTMRIALQDLLEDAINDLPAADQALCQGVLDGTWSTDIDAAIENAYQAIKDPFDQTVADVQTVLDTWNNTINPMLPELKDKVTDLIDIFKDVNSIEDLLNFDPTEMNACIDEITTMIDTAWPDIQNGINAAQNLYNDLSNLNDLADQVLDQVLTDLTGNPNTDDCLAALIANGAIQDLGGGDFEWSDLQDAFHQAILDEWNALKDQLDEINQHIQDCIDGIGQDALDFIKDKFNEIKDEIINAALDGCYTKTFRSDCYDFCDPNGVQDPGTAPDNCFLWLPVDFLQSPEGAVGAAASGALWALKQVGFLDGLQEWLNDNLSDQLGDALADIADATGSFTETLEHILAFITKAFGYIDLFTEGYHLGAYTELRPDLHMCIGYAGHGAYAQFADLGGDNFSIGARYTSHNVSKENRVQFRSGGFAVSAFGKELSLLPGIELNAQIQAFKLWDIREPFGIPLNLEIDADFMARVDAFATTSADGSGAPFNLPVDGSGSIPVGAFIVRDLHPVPNSTTVQTPANDHIWPRPEVYNVPNPELTPDAPEWEDSAVAVVSMGVNLPLEIDPPRTYLPAIHIITGVLVVVPWFDIAAGVEWKHQCDLMRDRILEKVNGNLPAGQQLDSDDFVRDMHAMAPDDLTADNGTYVFVEPGLGFDIFLGFNIWKVRIGVWASLGLFINIRPGGTGGIVDMNSALADALLHSNPPVEAPCEPVIQTLITEKCNNHVLGGDPDTEYPCTTGDSSCCITAKFDPPDNDHHEYSACIDDWTGFDQELCEEFNAIAEDSLGTFADIMEQAPGHSEKLDKLLAKLDTLGIGEKSVVAVWNDGVQCKDSTCGESDTLEDGGPFVSTAIIDLASLSECELHGYCVLPDGEIVHDVEPGDCAKLLEPPEDDDPTDPPPDPDTSGEPCPGERYTRIDIGDLVCAIYDNDVTNKQGYVRCWFPGGQPAPYDSVLYGQDPAPVSGHVEIECDSERCGHLRDPGFTNTVNFTHGIKVFGWDDPISCPHSTVDCFFADGPAYDAAMGHEGHVIVEGNPHALRQDSQNCQTHLNPVPDNTRLCIDEHLTIMLGCETASQKCKVDQADTFQQVEYTAHMICAIEKPPITLPHWDTPTEFLTGGPIRCSWTHDWPFHEVPGSPSTCSGVVCDDGYTCTKKSGIPPVCVLDFNNKNYAVKTLGDGKEPNHDFVDVATVGNHVVCGIHAADAPTKALGIDCVKANQDYQTCTDFMLQAPLGQYRDIEPAGVCTLCAVTLDRTQIVCWGDEVGDADGDGDASIIALTAPTLPAASGGGADLIVDMGGLSDRKLWDLDPSNRPYVVCAVLQSGNIICNDTDYEPVGGLGGDTCGEGNPESSSGNNAGGGEGWHPYMCYKQVDYEITGWEGDGCHPLQHGYASACGCGDDADCSNLNGETCDTDAGRCTIGGSEIDCQCDGSGGCPIGRVCVDGACPTACSNDIDCATHYECGADGACVPKHGIPYAEEITWGMANVEAPMHTINTYAMADLYATLIMTLGLGVTAQFKFIKKVREWTIFEYANAWDLGSTWKGWYQPGLEGRYQDECSDPDLQTTMTNRFPRSLTSNPYDHVFDVEDVPILRNCPNGGVCRYPEDLPDSVTPHPAQPWEYPDGNAGSVEDFILWCKDDMKEHKENPAPTTPEDLVSSLVDTYHWGQDVSYRIYATSQPCVDGKPVTEWLADLYPTYDDDGNMTDEGALGSGTCAYTDPTDGTVHTFSCSDITRQMMRVWGCLDKDLHPTAQSLWDEFGELQVTQDPDGTAHDWIDIDAMYFAPPNTDLSWNYDDSAMSFQYRNYFDWGLLPYSPHMVGYHWLLQVESCFDARFFNPAETECECTTDADCDTQAGEICGATGCQRPVQDPISGQITYEDKDCPIVSIQADVGQCCGDGVVQSEPVQVIAPAEEGTDQYVSHGCADDPDSEDPVCVGLYYVEECDEGPDGGDGCTSTCEALEPPFEAGACCMPEACKENLSEEDCLAQNAAAIFHAGVSCQDLDYCEAPPNEDAACCLPSGDCALLTAGVCVSAGGEWNADKSCDEVECQSASEGACCVGGECITYPDEALCTNKGGVWLSGQSCTTGQLCKQPWACCLSGGECAAVIASVCDDKGGAFSYGLTCDEVECEATGAPCPGQPVSASDSVFSHPGYVAQGPKINIVSPPNGATLVSGLKVPPFKASVSGTTIGLGITQHKVEWIVDGQSVAIKRSLKPLVLATLEPGAHAVAVRLIDQSNQPLGNPQSVHRIMVKMLKKCTQASDCVATSVCETQQCVKGYCQPKFEQGCCESDFDCRFGMHCAANQCVACVDASDCNDGNSCTADCCSPEGVCYHDPEPGCCTTNADCNDDNFCTKDVCQAGQCVSELSADPLCCNDDDDCEGPDVCHPAKCMKYSLAKPIKFSKGKSKAGKSVTIQRCRVLPAIPGCCIGDKDCDDGNPCTTNTCTDNNVCVTGLVAACCKKDADCEDGDACTVGQCKAGSCSYEKKEAGTCCNSSKDCDDKNACTVDLCDAGGGCQHLPKKGCCLDDSECDDGVFCTQDVCNKANLCSALPIKGCCEGDKDCDDGQTCTSDYCDDKNQCAANDIKGCCTADADCDDANVCTTNTCSADNKCESQDVKGCCTSDKQCDDTNVCTINTCGDDNTCATLGIKGCCNSDEQCDDANVCTKDTCSADNKCENQAQQDCCQDAKDCNDDNPCTLDTCGPDNTCQNVGIKNCCAEDTDCKDKNPCVTGTCSNNQCLFKEDAGCCQSDDECDQPLDPCQEGVCFKNTCQSQSVANCCNSDKDCDDANSCTTDTCNEKTNTCSNVPAKGCCAIDADCDDGDPCTTDTCKAGNCVQEYVKLCCETAEECDDKNACTIDSCNNGQCTYASTKGCCIDDSGCGKGQYCEKNKCTPKNPNGSACSSDAACTSGLCLTSCSSPVCFQASSQEVAGHWKWNETTEGWFTTLLTGSSVVWVDGGSQATAGAVLLSGKAPQTMRYNNSGLDGLDLVSELGDLVPYAAQASIVIDVKGGLAGKTVGVLELAVYGTSTWATFRASADGSMGSAEDLGDGWVRYTLTPLMAGKYDGMQAPPKTAYLELKTFNTVSVTLDNLRITRPQKAPAGCCGTDGDCSDLQKCDHGACILEK